MLSRPVMDHGVAMCLINVTQTLEVHDPVPKTKTKLNICKRGFSVAALTIWNQLPNVIKSSETIDTFQKKLKADLFEIAFPPYNFGGSMILCHSYDDLCLFRV